MKSTSADQELGNTVIIGSGIIGVSTAYYLAQSRTPGHTIHLVERTPKLFSSASGYAGGFLAADWFAPPTSALGQLSFQLHKELSDACNGRLHWGYSRTTGTSLSGGGRFGLGAGHDWLRQGGSRVELKAQHEFWDGKEGPAWLVKKQGSRINVMSESETTAQVDPRRLCEFLLSKAQELGVQIHHPAQVEEVLTDAGEQMQSVRISHSDNKESLEVPCNRLIITSGAWTTRVFEKLFPRSQLQLPISHLAGYSLVVRSPRWALADEGRGCHAVFATDIHGFSPEIFSRIGSEIYLAGLNSPGMQLPETASDIKADTGELDTLKKVAKEMLAKEGAASEALGDLDTIREGLCFRPIATRGALLLSRIADDQLGGIKTKGGGHGGVFVSAGHGPWGISLSLGTGKVLSQLVEGDAPCINIRGLSL